MVSPQPKRQAGKLQSELLEEEHPPGRDRVAREPQQDREARHNGGSHSVRRDFALTSGGKPYIAEDVESCPRCGGEHVAMLFFPLSNPANGLAWWGFCEEKHEPLLLGGTSSNTL